VLEIAKLPGLVVAGHAAKWAWRLRQAVFERALDRGIDRVEPVER
jgi:hypothetical protein